VVENSILGKFTYVSASSVLNNVSVGAFTSIGPSCKIGLGIHPTDKFVSTSPIFYSTKNMFKTKFTAVNSFDEYNRIEIGNDVWIGANVIIKDGVRIGDGAIIAAGAVVTKDVSPYEIIGGIPAKHIRFRFDEEKISFFSSQN
jgi:acetyltransferase-like isoleucine patch superfamily enzyme